MIKLTLILICVVFALFVATSVGVAVYICRKSGKKMPKVEKIEKPSHIKRLFFEFPYRLVCDAYNRVEDEFQDNGFHLIVGEQGSGKTITLVYLLMQYQKRYKKLNVRTNMGYINENGEIRSWKDLVFRNNGIYGQIDVLDEVQNWFNSLQSRDFPVEMFAEITQQRKQRKMIMGTSQVWQRVAKPIREQVKLVYKPITICGCLTIVPYYKPSVNADGEMERMRFRGVFYFVHNDEIRNAFDTYKKIAVMSLKGFKEQPLLGREETQHP